MMPANSEKTRLEANEKSVSSFVRRQTAVSLTGRVGPLRGLAAVTSVLLLAGCEAKPAPVAKLDRPVQVERVTFTQPEVTHEFSGVVRARYETDLGFRVGGKIASRLVNAGDRVHAGDVIARLDPRDLGLQVESAAAELTAATSNLAQTATDLERYTTLRERGYASVADFDRKKTAKDEAEGRVERAKRALDLARNQLAYSDLKADADGVITATLAEAGQVVTVGEAVARLAQSGEKEAVVALPETALAEARQSQASVRLWADANAKFAARLRELSPQADPATRTYLTRFTILDANDAVAFGMTATVTLLRSAEAPVARLPLSAVLNRGSGPSVFIVDRSGTLELRPVIVAAYSADQALVRAGVENGDQVVTLGVQKLESGSKVRLLNP
jgi:RND family efflux transporter MFP subunit